MHTDQIAGGVPSAFTSVDPRFPQSSTTSGKVVEQASGLFKSLHRRDAHATTFQTASAPEKWTILRREIIYSDQIDAMETHAHQILKRLSIAFLRNIGCMAAATEVRCPI